MPEGGLFSFLCPLLVASVPGTAGKVLASGRVVGSWAPSIDCSVELWRCVTIPAPVLFPRGCLVHSYSAGLVLVCSLGFTGGALWAVTPVRNAVCRPTGQASLSRGITGSLRKPLPRDNLCSYTDSQASSKCCGLPGRSCWSQQSLW